MNAKQLINLLGTSKEPKVVKENLNKILEFSKTGSEEKLILVSEGCVEEFLKVFELKNDDLNKILLDTLGELAKEEDNRTPMALEKVLEYTKECLNNENVEIQRLSSRLFANLSCYHEKNQGLIFKMDLVPRILEIWAVDNNNLLFTKTLVGFMTNLSYDNEERQVALGKVGIFDKLMECIPNDDEQLLNMTMNCIANLMNAEENKLAISKTKKMHNFIPLMTHEDEDIVEEAFDLVADIIVGDLCPNYIGSPEMVKGVMPLIDSELNEENQKKLFKILAYLSLHDDSMRLMIEMGALDIVSKLLHSKNETIVTSTVMWMGNLARTNETCKHLIKNGVLPIIMEFLSNENFKIQHLAAGVIRNLAVLAENRPIFLEYPEIFPKIIKLLSHKRIEIKDYGIECLNFLCNLEEACKIVIKQNVVAELMPQVKQKDVAKLKYGAVRVIYKLMMTLGKDVMLQVLKEDEEGYLILIFLMLSRFDILKKEGAILLSQFADSKEILDYLFSIKDFDYKVFMLMFTSKNLEILTLFFEAIKKCIITSEIAKISLLKKGLKRILKEYVDKFDENLEKIKEKEKEEKLEKEKMLKRQQLQQKLLEQQKEKESKKENEKENEKEKEKEEKEKEKEKKKRKKKKRKKKWN